MRRALVVFLTAGSLIAVAPASAVATIKPTVKPKCFKAPVKPAADSDVD